MSIGIEIIIGAVVGLIGIGVLVYIISIYNSLIRLRRNVDKAWANIEVILKQRHDELPKLIEVCKSYMKYEKSVLEEITKLRTRWAEASTQSEKIKISNQISAALKTLFAVAENYPKLRANENFLQLQSRISGLENELADRRELYNEFVTNYNIRIQSIPDKFVADIFKFAPVELFKVAEEEKKDVEIKL
ncbi:MAG: LemA family protein [Candidatus Aenigmatarchaeota archaeon]